MSLSWYDLSFPAEVAAEPVADLLRTLGGESRGGPLARRLPVVVETELSDAGVTWRIAGPDRTLRRLQQSAEAVLPGLRWARTADSQFPATVAVELRVASIERLLATDLAEAASRRILGVVRELRRNERLLVQWQVGPWLARSPIEPASNKRTHSIWTIGQWGRPERDSEQVAAARKKAAEHVLACVGRIAVAGASGARAHQLIASAAGAMQLLRAPGVGISRRAVPSWVARHRLRSHSVPALGPPCRLTPGELAGVIGWPLGNPRLPGVSYAAARALAIDQRALQYPDRRPGQRVLGEAAYPGQDGQVVVMPPRESLRHLHVIGPTGVGKSTLLARLILADIAGGRSVVAIDPKGDLVTEVLRRVPKEQAHRVIVLDPTDEAPVGFNPLDGGSVGVDSVLHVLRSVWSDSWGPRLGDVLLAGLLTLSYSPGHSLAELPLLLTDARFRRPLVERAVAQDPIGLASFWPWFDGLSPDLRAQVLGPVMSRLRALLVRPELRGVLAQPQPRLDLSSVFSRRQVLLVRLPKGRLGAEGTQLLGSLLVSQLWRIAQRRTELPPERRHAVSLVLDEFQEFLRLPLDLPDALVQARGLGLGLTLAHQHLGQLSTGVRAAVLANAGSRVVFRCDHDDATTMAKRSAGLLKPEDLMGLEPFHAYASVMAGPSATTYGSLRTLPLDPSQQHAETTEKLSHEHFGVARQKTERHLRSLMTSGADLDADPGEVGRRRLGDRS